MGIFVGLLWSQNSRDHIVSCLGLGWVRVNQLGVRIGLAEPVEVHIYQRP